ncbi:SlyX family protein [Gymnodinialimonas ceratoperidinii]|uniref:SlyX family protein n=1 Tax=Gymnodinialimonas ceratoperidinii TaxID=2856823 RepID=A0A8F6TVR6_9RHOB|nr:SlyX family protein [Gymnodinialimonas ceratoperidinii]QXT39358.1 SlyX family protein [Gymnodinialimonas ceratoperidinii]
MSQDTRLEEQLAHLTKTVDDLSDVVARQDTEIALLTRRVEMLMSREAEREANANSGSIPLADQKPPHW